MSERLDRVGFEELPGELTEGARRAYLVKGSDYDVCNHSGVYLSRDRAVERAWQDKFRDHSYLDWIVEEIELID